MNVHKITQAHTSRRADIYIRQSTPHQVMHNLESQKRQYDLVEKAKSLGFNHVEVIDTDLGVSGGVAADRQGFRKLVADVGLNKVGAVFGLELSRLSRNNTDLYQLLDLCAIFNTLVVLEDGIYNPTLADDRMLLGLKGTLSEAEISTMTHRMNEGKKNKARRGELIHGLPVGLIKTAENKIEKRPDKRIQETIAQVFSKFSECLSVRQTFMWFVQEGVEVPSISNKNNSAEIEWKIPGYTTMYNIITNPFYAGAYVYGRRKRSKQLKDGEIKQTTKSLPLEQWETVIKDSHEGYISWADYERNLVILSQNAKANGGRGAVGKGVGLLSGLLRCQHCGQNLYVASGGKNGTVPIYTCSSARLFHGKNQCIYFGGQRVDEAVSNEVLRVIEPLAIDASLEALNNFNKSFNERKQLLLLELEAAQYESDRIFRQYDKSDPENRLVTGTLEKKWEASLKKVDVIKENIDGLALEVKPVPKDTQEIILQLANDLPALWNAQTTSQETKKKIIRTVIEEIVCNVDKENYLIDLHIHWVGGIHTNLQVKKNRTGQHRWCTSEDTVAMVRKLAKHMSDERIAPLLNRHKLKTGKGNPWTRDRVCSLRHAHDIPVYDGIQAEGIVNLQEASESLGICAVSVKKLIESAIIEAEQIIPGAPYFIPVVQLSKKEVQKAVKAIKNGNNRSKCRPELLGQKNLF
jgi:DNA invertase Pin-like site-specific DNA recombinase